MERDAIAKLVLRHLENDVYQIHLWVMESYVKLTQLAYYPECTIFFFATVVSISQNPYNLSPLTLVKRIFTQFRFSILTKGTTKLCLIFSR